MARTFEPKPFPAGRVILAGLAIALLIAAPAASAGSLEEYKSSGEIGEQTDGYVAAVNAKPSADVRKVVEDINDGRRKKYTAIAEKNETDAATVGQLAGKKLVKRAAPGTNIRKPGEDWRKR